MFYNQKKNKTKPPEIKIINFKKEPKESIIKKPSKTSSKIKISFTIENCVKKISSKPKYPINLCESAFIKGDIHRSNKKPRDKIISGKIIKTLPLKNCYWIQ